MAGRSTTGEIENLMEKPAGRVEKTAGGGARNGQPIDEITNPYVQYMRTASDDIAHEAFKINDYT